MNILTQHAALNQHAAPPAWTKLSRRAPQQQWSAMQCRSFVSHLAEFIGGCSSSGVWPFAMSLLSTERESASSSVTAMYLLLIVCVAAERISSLQIVGRSITTLVVIGSSSARTPARARLAPYSPRRRHSNISQQEKSQRPKIGRGFGSCDCTSLHLEPVCYSALPRFC